ncbi:hypothetical protein [Halobacteriovorax marinus]|uniref:hypothetical protein n=1 Tax=Halobacteriovorax marinus TaxID=97084 RepID=UPI003A92F480
MKIKTFKNISVHNKVRFINELEGRGYDVSRNGDDYLLSSNAFRKVFSTWGLILIVKGIKLSVKERTVKTQLSFNIFALLSIYCCAFGTCIAMILREPNNDQSKIFFIFLFLLLLASFVLFIALRSEILKDIKEAIKEST